MSRRRKPAPRRRALLAKIERERGPSTVVEVVCSDRGTHPQRLIEKLVDGHSANPSAGRLQASRGRRVGEWHVGVWHGRERVRQLFECRTCGRKPQFTVERWRAITEARFASSPGVRRVVVDISYEHEM